MSALSKIMKKRNELEQSNSFSGRPAEIVTKLLNHKKVLTFYRKYVIILMRNGA